MKIMLVKLSVGVLSLFIVQKIPSIAVKLNDLFMEGFVGVLYLLSDLFVSLDATADLLTWSWHHGS